MRKRMAQLAVVAGVAGLLAGGCGPTKTTAAGTVTYRGRPVTWGSVTLVAADGVSYPGALQADGSFAIPGVPVGRVRVAVSSPDPGPAGGAKVGPPPSAARPGVTPRPATDATWFPIPERYADPDRSGLTAEVRPGRPLAIELS